MSTESTTGGGPGGELAPLLQTRFRATRRQQVFIGLPLLLMPTVLLLEQLWLWSTWRNSGNRTVLPVFFFAVLAALLAGEAWLLCRRVGVTLTVDHAIVHNLRRRQIAWADVVAVRVEPLQFARTVVIYEQGGRRTRLRAPTTQPLGRDRDFDAKARAINDWWSEHRGNQWAVSDLALTHGFRGTPDRLRLRPGVPQILVCTLVLLYVAASAGLNMLPPPVTGSGNSLARRLPAALVLAGALLGIWQWCVRPGITLTADRLAVRRLRRGRQIAWTDVQAIDVERRRGGQRIVVREPDGRLSRLAAPRVGFLLWDRDFDAKTETLYRWWREHQDTDQVSVVSDARPPARLGASGPTWWKQVLVGLFCIAVGGELLLTLLLTVLFVSFPDSRP